jgi:hypothetical protein
VRISIQHIHNVISHHGTGQQRSEHQSSDCK